LEKLCFAFADEVVTPTPVKIKKPKIKVIPNAIDKIFFVKRSKKEISSFLEMNNISTDQKKILYVGRIDQYKGLINLVKAISILANISSPIRLIMCYPTTSVQLDTMRKIKEMAINTPITFLTNLRPHELSLVYQGSDVCVLPSEQELSPRVMYESFASGTPFMGTRTGNVAVELSKVDPKLILENNSVQEIVRKINYLFSLSSRDLIRIKANIRNIANSTQITSVETQFAKLLNIQVNKNNEDRN